MKRKGFTIIEVVLVLAIAGLIFLMVFIALPTLQRNQRDTQRRNLMDRVASQVNQYSSNNQGRVPYTGTVANEKGAWNNFRLNYLCTLPNCADEPQEEFRDPNGEVLTLEYRGNASGSVGNEAFAFGSNVIRVYGNANCEGENADFIQNGARRVAFRYKLEGAGTYCVDNG